jgi:hypothetical protein
MRNEANCGVVPSSQLPTKSLAGAEFDGEAGRINADRRPAPPPVRSLGLSPKTVNPPMLLRMTAAPGATVIVPVV